MLVTSLKLALLPQRESIFGADRGFKGALVGTRIQPAQRKEALCLELQCRFYRKSLSKKPPSSLLL